MRLYVGNLPFRLTDEELKEAFAAFGDVESANIVRDRHTNRSRGFGFVDMPNDEQAQAAIEGVKELGGRDLTINEARPRPERT